MSRVRIVALVVLSLIVVLALFSPSTQDYRNQASKSLVVLSQSLHKPLSCRVEDWLDDPLVREYGSTNIRLSRSYEGSGTRVQHLLKKALRGDPIKISVVGGSVSTGHAIRLPLTADNYMYARIHKWFQDTFPQTTVNLSTDGAIPATARTNVYFSYCLTEHIPLDSDLVLVELDINAPPDGVESRLATEAVLRTSLSLPNHPAVIYLSVFALSFDDMVHGWFTSLPASHWLDVPHVTIRWLLPWLMLHPERKADFFIDWANNYDLRHINANAHVALADMTIAYLREQLCLVQRHADLDLELPSHSDRWPTDAITQTLPRLRILDHWDDTKSVQGFFPRCRSITSQFDPLVPVRNHGWAKVNVNDKQSWQGKKKGDSITFEFSVAEGVAGFWYWLTSDASFGGVECVIDDQPDSARQIQGYGGPDTVNIFEWTRDLWQGLSSGKHELTCTLVTNGFFRISATVTR